MRIAILGAGHIGGTLAKKFGAFGHEIRLANSRDPETIRELATAARATATHAAEAVRDVDVVITSIPFAKNGDLKPILAGAPPNAVVIDTSNYFPLRDGVIPAIEAGRVESEWVSEQFDRPVVKAWNSILEGSLATRGHPPGDEARSALPVAGNEAAAKLLAMYLVELTGFDAVDGGSISESWRQQPGSPAYTTELKIDELRAALERADRASLPAKRDRMVQIIFALEGRGTNEQRLRIARECLL